MTLHPESGREISFPFDVPEANRNRMLKGLDAIGETLMHASDIDLYESKRALDRPWLEA